MLISNAGLLLTFLGSQRKRRIRIPQCVQHFTNHKVRHLHSPAEINFSPDQNPEGALTTRAVTKVTDSLPGTTAVEAETSVKITEQRQSSSEGLLTLFNLALLLSEQGPPVRRWTPRCFNKRILRFLPRDLVQAGQSQNSMSHLMVRTKGQQEPSGSGAASAPLGPWGQEVP